MGGDLGDYLGQLVSKTFGDLRANVGNTFQTAADNIGSLMNAPQHLDKPNPQVIASQMPQPQVPVVDPQLQQNIAAGLSRYSNPAPAIATASPLLAQAGSQLPDPYLPAVMALMEKGVAPNNPWNLMGTQNGHYGAVNYPDLRTALMGGQNGSDMSQGLVGTILNNPAYARYRQTGNIADFFPSYTPPGAQHGNPTLEELLARYSAIRSLFTQPSQAGSR